MQHPTSPPAEAAAAPAPGEPAPHYGLPPLPQLPCPDFRGPTPWSNWVIKGRLLAGADSGQQAVVATALAHCRQQSAPPQPPHTPASIAPPALHLLPQLPVPLLLRLLLPIPGAYPASLDDQETDRILTTLLELGVNTFVCLQAEFSLHTPEAAWRSGQGLRPYIKDAQRLLIRARETNSHRIKQVGWLMWCGGAVVRGRGMGAAPGTPAWEQRLLHGCASGCILRGPPLRPAAIPHPAASVCHPCITCYLQSLMLLPFQDMLSFMPEAPAHLESFPWMCFIEFPFPPRGIAGQAGFSAPAHHRRQRHL